VGTGDEQLGMMLLAITEALETNGEWECFPAMMTGFYWRKKPNESSIQPYPSDVLVRLMVD
jgi:hypothetical protein